MGEHRLPRTPPPEAPEAFSFREEATGKITLIREASDSQLAKCIEEVSGQEKQFMMQAMQCIQASGHCGQVKAAMQFELDRRSKSIQIVTSLKTN